jgi:hypothetical protein
MLQWWVKLDGIQEAQGIGDTVEMIKYVWEMTDRIFKHEGKDISHPDLVLKAKPNMEQVQAYYRLSPIRHHILSRVFHGRRRIPWEWFYRPEPLAVRFWIIEQLLSKHSGRL